MDIQDKVAIVTGAIGGIGFATVQCLLRSQVKVVFIFSSFRIEQIIDRSDTSNNLFVLDSLKTLREEFEETRYGYYRCNVTDVKEFMKCYKAITASTSYVDILINNAGIGSDINIDLIIDVNFKAVVHCTMTALNYMDVEKKGRGGVIVNIASVLGLVNSQLSPLYCATKHAVVSFVRSMKEHNKKFGVRIVCVCPHATNTNMMVHDNLKDAVLDFVDSKSVNDHSALYLQKPVTVANAILEIIEKGADGAVWVSQSDLPPFPVEEEDPSQWGVTV